MVEGMSLLASTFRSASADGEPVSRSTWIRALAMAALAPIVTGLLATAALLTLILAIATSSHFSTGAVLSATGPVWLAAYQVPLEIDGLPLGVLPLLPTLLVCVLIARAASGAAQRLGCSTPDRAPLLIGAVAGTHAVVGGIAGILAGDAFITVDVLTAVFVPALVSGLGAAVGVAKPCGLTAAARRYLDPLAVAGLRAGALGLAGLVAAGAATLLLATALSASTVAALSAELAPGAGSATGLWLVSLGYVPNAVIMAMGFATGPGLQLGGVEIGPLSFSGGGVPPFPLLGALPDEQALWWPVLMLLPAAVGAGVGWWLRTCHDDPVARLRTVGVAGALVGFGTVVAGFLAGGSLAAGPFDPVGIPLGFVSITAFLWIAVPGGLVAWFAGPRPAAAEDDTDAEDTDTDTDVDADADTDEDTDTDAATDEADDADSDTGEDSDAGEDSDSDEDASDARESDAGDEAEEPTGDASDTGDVDDAENSDDLDDQSEFADPAGTVDVDDETADAEGAAAGRVGSADPTAGRERAEPGGEPVAEPDDELDLPGDPAGPDDGTNDRPGAGVDRRDGDSDGDDDSDSDDDNTADDDTADDDPGGPDDPGDSGGSRGSGAPKV
ncbi:cell division protein PerM [Prauserella alba]|uniref:Uncharacterized protein n=1 Tax=Prauserella alba TaxID=176898 RepID=A0ABN1VEF3_9PSEU|nr:DUF6350 family protein [Prauserella alba]MCP2182609.1 hypothetical protein [Prauserella alba]